MQVDTMCIIGAGTMGTGIAQVAAQAGIRALVIDSSAEAIARSRSLLEATLRGGIDRGKLTEEQAQTVRALTDWDTSLQTVSQADWIIEAVFEDRSVKDQVLREVSAAARPGVPIATNTSTLPIRELALSCADPTGFLGMHFFNPPPAMKLVEVIPGEATSEALTRAAVELCERLGKTPLIAPDIPGFLVNRAFGALVAAAVDILLRGVEPEAIDASMEMGLGHKMGPLRTADLVGLDVVLALLTSLFDQTGDPRFAPPQVLARMVGEGKLGKKSKEGFYRYE